MPRKASPFTYSASMNSWLNNPSKNAQMPGTRKYRETPTPAEDRVQAFLEGTPKFKDVKSAHYRGKITTEEAQDLRPNDYFPDNVGMYKDKSTEATHRRARLKG